MKWETCSWRGFDANGPTLYDASLHMASSPAFKCLEEIATTFGFCMKRKSHKGVLSL